MYSSESDRVVVTGMGVVSPCGIGLEPFWDSLINCKSGIGPITLFDTTNHPLKFAGEIKNFSLKDYIPNAKPKRCSRQTQFALVAAQMAVEDAGLSDGTLSKEQPVSFVLGISCSAIDIIIEADEIMKERGAKRIRPHMVGSCQPHAVGAMIAKQLGVQASITTLSGACPSGLDAVLVASKMIKQGRADRVIVGAGDSPLHPASAASFAASGIPSVTTDFPPEEACRPFDRNRSGVVLSEGAGFLILERLDVAISRGAKLYAEVLGGESLTDAFDGEKMDGLLSTMEFALKNSGIQAKDIDYICANAAGEPLGDKNESDFIKRIFGDLAYRIPISSIRGVLGHALAPSGISQIIACALAMKTGSIPPTANLTESDPHCDLDYVPLTARNIAIQKALINAHGIGSENTSVILGNIK